MIQGIFLVGGFVLAAALVPAVVAGGGVPLSSALVTGGVLAGYTGAFLKMGQRVSAVGTGLNALLWAVLAVQAL